MLLTNLLSDSKQARDLVQILQESKQQIDPKLHEMARYGGGGGGGRWGGRGRGGGGRGGGRGSTFLLTPTLDYRLTSKRLDWQ